MRKKGMSHFSKSVPYLAALSNPSISRKFYKALVREAGDHLIKTLSELIFNVLSDTVPIKKGSPAKKFLHTRKKLFSFLTRKSVSLKRKRARILDRGYPVLPILVEATKPTLKELSRGWLEEW
jgi:hypothetical protein